jgi:3-oxoacyl-(acyl-carrier-protein) synthase
MRRALEKAQRDPCQVDFLELHATGTARGDPTEANWVGRAFKRDGDILVGSVKGNIGCIICSRRYRASADRLCTDTRRSRPSSHL